LETTPRMNAAEPVRAPGNGTFLASIVVDVPF
jgi:hypothetical protein